jgi:hypothetical protein
VLNIKNWWSMLAVSSGVSRAVEALPDATDGEELGSWWLLPGDVTYCAARPPQQTIRRQQSSDASPDSSSEFRLKPSGLSG